VYRGLAPQASGRTCNPAARLARALPCRLDPYPVPGLADGDLFPGNQAVTPFENILAMYDEAHRYGRF